MNERRQFVRKLGLNLLSVLSLVLFISLWIWFSGTHNRFLPTPAQVWARNMEIAGSSIAGTTMAGHTWASLKRVFTGLLYAAVLGIAFGTMIGWNKTFRALFQPLFEMLRPVPPLAWVPLITVWFGIDEIPKIILVFIGTFTPTVVNTYSGVHLAHRDNIAVGRIFGAKGLRMLTDIVMPSALPAIMAGLKTALTTGWGVVLAAEMISARNGLGMLITRGSDSDDIPLAILAMIIIGFIGALMSACFTFLERRLSPWRTDLN